MVAFSLKLNWTANIFVINVLLSYCVVKTIPDLNVMRFPIISSSIF